MRLTIHRGTKEIGGSCVELATATTRIVLDVGMPLVDAAREPFDQKSIRGKTVEQLIAEGVMVQPELENRGVRVSDQR